MKKSRGWQLRYQLQSWGVSKHWLSTTNERACDGAERTERQGVHDTDKLSKSQRMYCPHDQSTKATMFVNIGHRLVAVDYATQEITKNGDK